METTRDRLLAAEKQLRARFIKREDAIRVILLAHLSGTNYLFVGVPGSAKTALAQAFAKHITEAKFFDLQFGPFTLPADVFGEFDIEEWKRGKREYLTTGMLPEANFAFLDELFKGSEGCLQMMLRIVNEHLFTPGKSVPLMTAGAATNWPEVERRDAVIEAFYDRFVLRLPVEDLVDEDDLVAMLGASRARAAYVPAATVTLAELQAAAAEVDAVTISSDIDRLLAQTRNRVMYKQVRGQAPTIEVELSSRRLSALTRIMQASAWLAGRDEVTVEDFACLKWGLWVNREDMERVETVIARIDADEVRKIVGVIDEGRAAIEHVRAQGGGAAVLHQAVETVKNAASKASEMFGRPVLTERGREDVRTAMRGLKEDFNWLVALIPEGRS